MMWVCLILCEHHYHLTGRGIRGMFLESVAVEESGILGCYMK